MECLHYQDIIRTRNEKRRFPRIPCSAPVEYSIRDRIYRNLSRDISATGLFIETWLSFSVGEKLTLNIPLSDSNKNFQINAKIVRAVRQGIGVVFT